MSKGTWRELLPCKECYQVVKNKDRLALEDRVQIDVYTESDETTHIHGLKPFYTFHLTIDSIKRPGAQRYHQIHLLLSDISLQRCEEVLEGNCKSHHRDLWVSSFKDKLLEDVQLLPDKDHLEKLSQNAEWIKKKKKEFKTFYAQLSHKPICHGKGCHVDFYLSPGDNGGLIAKIKRREKLKFCVDEVKGGYKYIGDVSREQNMDKIIRNVLIKYFVISIYSKNRLALKLNGNVFIIDESRCLSLEDLMEQGIEMASTARWSVYG
ncbi:MAG: hypothetical protein IEMM0008_1329 [bacterium]|nr:MAG: hypothetical protein IEMM0008_1329 [bacterium]